jgi:hypothetical protein
MGFMGWNVDFQLIFSMNICLSVKQKASLFGFWAETRYFLKPQNFVYIIVRSNWTRMWALRRWNIDFWPVFAMNRRLLVKQNDNPFEFWAETRYFSKPRKTNCVQHYKFYPNKNMCLTGMKCEFYAFFTVNRHFFGKTDS